ncbi:MAG: DNA polymerase III subunit alpha, partial [Actinomycetales bacterium]
IARHRRDLAEREVRMWQQRLPHPHDVVLEAVSHCAAGAEVGSSVHAARTLALARAIDAPVVLTNQVRYADVADAPVADVLDAARRLVPLDPRHLDRRSAHGYLKSGKEMAEVAREVARLAGGGETDAQRLLADTRRLADQCVLDPAADLGLGLGAAGAHFPEVEIVDDSGMPPDAVLRAQCEAGIGRRGLADTSVLRARLDEELDVIARLGFAGYFLTVADVVRLITSMGVRCAARGSGAGSLVNYLLGVSGVDPLRHGLLMARFLSPLREALPDIDIDVESARRTEIYEQILRRYGGERVSCVSMMDTYRVRHAIRDVGAALGLPPGEIDAVAKAFPHIRARDARAALGDLPELRASGIAASGSFEALLTMVERLDGLPRHIALHPCGVLLSDRTMLDRTPVESSWMGFPMSQFDKDDVEELGLLKLDVLGVRMQSAMAHALDEVVRVDGPEAAGIAEAGRHRPDSVFLGDGRLDLDSVPLDDAPTFELIQSTRTLGCFQIESPGQRELVGKFAPETFGDLIIDISLFRPGPVKSDMVRPFLEARQGWREPEYLAPDLRPHLEETGGVVVFHEQVLQIIDTLTGCGLAFADEVRRALGDPVAKEDVRLWFPARAYERGYDEQTVSRAWEVLEAFASFGFCKAHAAAFALPTYQSAWLKAHHPAAFLAGVLTHDPGMYPKRLILDDARNFGIAVLGLDVNRSDSCYRVERVGITDEPPPAILGEVPRQRPDWMPASLPDARGYGIRLSLADVKGISDAEVARIVAGRPYATLSDFWHRARVSRPVVERLVLAGGFDDLYGIGSVSARLGLRRRHRLTRRDLLLQVAELERFTTGRGRPARSRRTAGGSATSDARVAERDVSVLASKQSQAAAAAPAPEQLDVQLALDFGAEDVSPQAFAPSGLPEMSDGELVRAELEILGLDASAHILDFYEPVLNALNVVRSRDILRCRSRSEILIAGVKVATQTPPIRSGRRVVFVTLDDATGPVDATFFEDAQGPYAATVFHSWLLIVRGIVRRTGPRGVSVRATGAWELPTVHAAYQQGGVDAAVNLLATATGDFSEAAVLGAAESRSTRPVMSAPLGSDAIVNPVAISAPPAGAQPFSYGSPWAPPRPGEGQPVAPAPAAAATGDGRSRAGGMGPSRRVLVHPSGFRQSPYADIKPAGEPASHAAALAQAVDLADLDTPATAPRKLWHASPGSAGH